MAESKLTDLIAKLEAATEGSHELNRAMGLAIGELHLDAKGELYRIDRDDGGHTYGGSGDETIITPRWTTSLDAALALVERTMVPYLLDIGGSWEPSDKGAWPAWTVRWYPGGSDRDGKSWHAQIGSAATPALALCVALLSALQLQGGSEQ